MSRSHCLPCVIIPHLSWLCFPHFWFSAAPEGWMQRTGCRSVILHLVSSVTPDWSRRSCSPSRKDANSGTWKSDTCTLPSLENPTWERALMLPQQRGLWNSHRAVLVSHRATSQLWSPGAPTGTRRDSGSGWGNRLQMLEGSALGCRGWVWRFGSLTCDGYQRISQGRDGSPGVGRAWAGAAAGGGSGSDPGPQHGALGGMRLPGVPRCADTMAQEGKLQEQGLDGAFTAWD